MLFVVIDAVRVFDEQGAELKRSLLGYVARNAKFIYNHRDLRKRVYGSAGVLFLF